MAQEESRRGRKERRWLLPFTTGVDLPTIEQALRLAEAAEALLVAVSFLAPSEGRGVRLELIQQSNDFLEAVRHKALRLSVPVECHEVRASNILASITTQIRDLGCGSIMLASEGDRALLLYAQELRQLVLNPPARLMLLRFSPQTTSAWPGPVARVLSWMRRPPGLPCSETPSQVPVREERAEVLVERPSKKEA